MGYSVINLHAFGIGAFVRPLELAFGWSRTEVMLGLTVASASGTLIYPIGGAMLDRFGARVVGLIGVAIVCTGIGLLGLADGTLASWIAIWLFISCGIALVQGMTWTSVVAARFKHARGLAIAAVLNGSALTASVVPLVSTGLITSLGWRWAFFGVGVIWFAVAFPLVFLLFRTSPDLDRGSESSDSAEPQDLPGVTLAEALRMPAYWRIILCMFAFILYTMALSPNLIALLTEKGATPAKAAQIAALMGVFGLIARLSVGHLLDRLPTRLVATSVFVLPIVGGAILLVDNPSLALLALSVACFGATIGAENDVLYFLVARYCGLRRFGALLGVIASAGAVAGTIAPVAAGWMHDRSGSYDSTVMILIILMAISALATATIGKPDPRASSPR